MTEKMLARNRYMLKGPLAAKGYDWWWHNLTARHAVTGAERAFFIEYYICNPALGRDVPLFGGPGERPSYGMVKVGCWGHGARQIHNFVGTRTVGVESDRLGITIGACTLSETRMAGRCTVSAEEAIAHPEWASDAGSLAWDLSIDKKIAFSVGWGASALPRLLNLFEMYWHAQGIKTDYAGWVELDGERYVVTPETCFGYADKNWGADFTSPWLWIGTSDLVSRTSGRRLNNSALDIGGGRPRVLGVPLDGKVLAFLSLEGADYEFNFSKVWQGSSVEFAFAEGEVDHRWTVRATNRQVRMEVDLTCRRDEMLLVRYQSPDGARRHRRLWNGGTGRGVVKLFERRATEPFEVIDIGHVGCEYGVYD